MKRQPTLTHMSTSRAGTAVVLASVLLAAGCSSSKSGGSPGASSGGASSGGANKSVTIGVLTDVTGPAASGNKTAVHGVQAGTYYAARNGYRIKYVVGDTATNPTTTLSVAQKLVTQDKVSAVVAVSALTFAAANYLTARGIPVVGAGQDGPEWLTAKNMFSVFGALDTTKVATTTGTFFKMQGVTNLGAIGYSVSPISSEAAKASAESAKQAGIKVGYLNARFPFGSTNVAPVALAMKAAGVNGFTATVDPNTSFALISALRRAECGPEGGLARNGLRRRHSGGRTRDHQGGTGRVLFTWIRTRRNADSCDQAVPR